MKKYFTITNTLSLSRIIFLPILFALFLSDQIIAFFIVYALVSITDFVDGIVARMLKQVTQFGKELDSLADTSFHLASIFFIYLMHPGLTTAILAPLIALATSFAITMTVSLVKLKKLKFMHTRLFKTGSAGIYFVVVLGFFMNIEVVATIVILLLTLAFIEELAIILKYGDVDADIEFFWSLNK
ncbi:MAG: CDP-alcohol phosphatidyltransferase family protein [bacterium]|nr:CDP-alcohol phosphatidyltransferase family protein [bacterium]